MAKQSTEKSRYKSKYTTEETWITANQYLAELFCERMAKKDKNSLPVKFWNTKNWKGVFYIQLQHANRLINQYSKEAVFAAVHSIRSKPFYSLAAPDFEKLVKEYFEWLSSSQIKDNQSEEYLDNIPSDLPPSCFRSKSVLDEI